MIYYRILRAILSIISSLTFFLTPITTFVLGLLGAIPLIGFILIIALTLIWLILFFLPLLGMSYLCSKVKFLTPIIAVVAIPLSTLAFLFANLAPSFGELEGRFSKILIASVFPLNWQLWRIISKKLPPENFKESENLEIMMIHESSNQALEPFINFKVNPYIW